MRRLLIVLLAVLVAAGGASFLVWRWAEGQMADGVAAWADSMRAQGWKIAVGAPERGGWPLAAAFTLPDVAVAAGPELPGQATWTAQRVTLRADVLRPYQLVARVAGQQTVQYGGGPAIPFSADRFEVTIPLPAGAPPRAAALDAAGLRFGPPADGMTVGLLEGQSTWNTAAGTGQPAVTLRLSAEAIALPPASHPPLGSNIASATIDSTLSGPLPPPGGFSAMAAAWRSGGGTLDLSHIAIGWGPLGVTGGVTLSLDAAMQPAGTANLRLVGYDDALADLAAEHVLSAHAAQAAKAVLGLLAQSAQGGGAAGIAVPLTLRDQTLSMGLFPLARLPRLLWPDAPGSANSN